MRRPTPDPNQQPSLPIDDLDVPVPYQLTARARRLVAPDSVPSLQVVPDDVREDDSDAPDLPTDLDDPHDPRSARARALRRSGMGVPTIARTLGVDEVVVRGWIRDLGHGHRRLRPVAATRTPTRGTPRRQPPSEPASAPDVDHDAVRDAFAAARAEAASTATSRMQSAEFVRGLSLVAATADIDQYAVVVTTRDLDVARTIRAWLADHAGVDPRDVRVVLRLGDTSGADLTLHRWADALDVPLSRIGRTQWHGAPDAAAVEALVRVADPQVAARVAGWRDVLLGSPHLASDHHDVAF